MSPHSHGQAIVEYALVVVGVSLVVALLIFGFGSGLLESTSTKVSGWL